MHELSIVQGILKIIKQERQKHNFRKVNTIEITCGRYNCLSQENVGYCLKLLGDSELGQDCLLKVNLIVTRLESYRCLSCGEEFQEEQAYKVQVCPYCGKTGIEELNNSSICVRKLEVE